MYRDHDCHRREFARYSKRDAEAYDRYSRDVLPPLPLHPARF